MENKETSSDEMLSDNYSFSLVNIECMPVSARFNVVMDLKESVEDLLPYLAAVFPGCTYFHGSGVVQFMEGGHIVAVYPLRITITDVGGQEEATGLCRDYFQKILQVRDRQDTITPVYEKRPTLKVLDLLRALPGTNCGLCGSPTCMAFAAGMLRREGRIADCEPLMREVEKYGEFLRQLQSNGYEIP